MPYCPSQSWKLLLWKVNYKSCAVDRGWEVAIYTYLGQGGVNIFEFSWTKFHNASLIFMDLIFSHVANWVYNWMDMKFWNYFWGENKGSLLRNYHIFNVSLWFHHVLLWILRVEDQYENVFYINLSVL